MTEAFSIVALGSGHDRAGFSCGVEALGRYFREQVSQDIKRRATACYVALDVATGKVTHSGGKRAFSRRDCRQA